MLAKIQAGFQRHCILLIGTWSLRDFRTNRRERDLRGRRTNGLAISFVRADWTALKAPGRARKYFNPRGGDFCLSTPRDFCLSAPHYRAGINITSDAIRVAY